LNQIKQLENHRRYCCTRLKLAAGSTWGGMPTTKTGELSRAGVGRRRRLILASQKPGADGEGDLEQHRGPGTRFGRRGGGGGTFSPEQCSPWQCMVGQRETAWRGRLLSREVVRRSLGAQDGGDEAGGGLAQSDVTEVLSSGWCSLVGGEWREGHRLAGLELWPAWRTDPPADDDTEVHEVVAVAPSGGAWHLEQRQTVGDRAERMWREQWSGGGSGEVKKSGFASKPRHAEDKDARGGAHGR
jgi:hypothetical protein